MSAYSEFFLDSPPTVAQLDLLEISHPDFTQTYYVQRNVTAGVTVTHEDASSHDYEYVPMRVKPLGTQTDLDQELEITFGDLGEILPAELDAVAAANGFQTKPSVLYRVYRSDDLSAPIFGPVDLQIDGISFNREGASFRAKAAAFNVTRTGETYRIEEYPMLEGLA